jgi:PadR family transcriptional regulator PadR
VLSAIVGEGSYGYKIIKDTKPYVSLSESTLYTILKRLETGGLLTVRSVEYDGRLRKYYKITARGLARLEDFKREWQEVMRIYQFVVKGENGNE